MKGEINRIITKQTKISDITEIIESIFFVDVSLSIIPHKINGKTIV